MGKIKSHFVCNQCGAVSPKWVGRCPECGSWNSFTEEVEEKIHQISQNLPETMKWMN